MMANKKSMAYRTLKLIDLAWQKFGCRDKKVYDLPDAIRKDLYFKVCKRVAKAVARLRRIGGFQFAYLVVGENMATDCLFALVGDKNDN